MLRVILKPGKISKFHTVRFKKLEQIVTPEKNDLVE